MFRKDPLLFNEYHRGFRAAVASWPVNPVDIIVAYLRNKPREWIVADLGCGDAKIAREAPNRVLSFDLMARGKRVIACDIAKVRVHHQRHVRFIRIRPRFSVLFFLLFYFLVPNNACDGMEKLPVPDELFDIAIFSLSLMGTNYVDFLREAHRVLKPT
jgi:ubiquinone/menaquinone biosynthesis C-methylase UbiE